MLSHVSKSIVEQKWKKVDFISTSEGTHTLVLDIE